MVVKESKSVALDTRDLNSAFSEMKGYGPVMSLAVIAVLSVCAAFFIYRSAKGQRKGNGENSVTEPVDEDERASIPKKRGLDNDHPEHPQSTGIMEESQGIHPADLVKDLPVGFELSDLSSALRDLEKEVGEDWRVSAEDHGDQDGTGCPKVDDLNGHLAEEDGEEQTGTEVRAKYDDDLVVTQCGGDDDDRVKGLVGDVSKALEELSEYLEKDCMTMDLLDLHVKEAGEDKLCSPDSAYGEGELEVEKASRARDLRSSSTNTVDQDFTYYQQNCADCPTEQAVQQRPLEGEQKAAEDLTWAMQRIHKDAEVLMATHSPPEMQFFYKPDYLSFSPEGFPGVMDGCVRMKPELVSPMALAPLQSHLSNSKEQEDSQAQESDPDKTEINIMEAIMDTNEWLTGNEGQPDTAWQNLSAAGDAVCSSAAEEESRQEAEWDTEKSEGFSETYASSDDDDLAAAAKRAVVAVAPMPQTVRVSFSVHYVTERPSQRLAVTGDRHELGAWRGFVPLERGKGGFWACTVALPADAQVQWKFVVVEDGEVSRWEECSNRQLVLTGQEEDARIQRWWGCL